MLTSFTWTLAPLPCDQKRVLSGPAAVFEGLANARNQLIRGAEMYSAGSLRFTRSNMWTLRNHNVYRDTHPHAPPSPPPAKHLGNMHPAAAVVAITKRNSTKSPLFRLPGEIRNILYEYVTGHYSIYHTSDGHLIVGPIDPWDWRHTFVEFPSVANLLALTLVCRQTYIESRLHIFTNNTFDTKNFFYFQRRVENLSTEQKNAISTITLRFDCMGKIGFNIYHLTDTLDPTEHFLVKPYLEMLPAFAGLKRVVMDSTNMTQRDDEYNKYPKAMEGYAVFGIWRLFQKDGMLVEFIEGPVFRLRACCGKCESCTQREGTSMEHSSERTEV
ncbi:uncharacterized protein CC84DRAFT_1253940 [Paraphaeosphaeria sporulosa]|uniref:Uncharacterized protein n=1 Tax=Paraphaeosphaeria sporulosa TaxID=1460663 RepID=A0A177CX51_9PLEO|nr:uncharacterized protein CC84DRAFT_1253940 [Paraphaeosphaeria sporulosa]OAG11482.1 hypothetical protein CC84DRAFT_1253940 [Paraphaeosphaeria sporulosa]